MITVDTIQSVNFVLAVATLLTIVVSGVLLWDMYNKQYLRNAVLRFGMAGAFCVTLGASLITLVYSEIFGIVPCGLCWFERIFLYPQIILLATALYLKDRTMPLYGIVLSAFGCVISLYHHYIQMGGSQFIKCPVAGAGIDCAKRFIFEFGFITFPFMAVTLFLFLIVIYLYLFKFRL